MSECRVLVPQERLVGQKVGLAEGRYRSLTRVLSCECCEPVSITQVFGMGAVSVISAEIKT